MNFEQPLQSAALFACAAVLAAFDAHAQMPAPGAADCSGRSESSGEVARVIDGRSFVFTDGREVRLAAIETPLLVPDDEDEVHVAAARAAKTALETLALHHNIVLRVLNTNPDRYGRLVAHAFSRTSLDQSLLQRELLVAGQALLSPAALLAPLAARCRTYLRDAERDARTHGLGLWGEPYYVVKKAASPVDVLAEQGRFTLVEGRVTSVRESGGVVYVNFGQRWSDHFTVTILKRNEGIFVSAGLTPQALVGRNVEVRGWVEERSGPTIEAVRPEQIEIVY